MDWWIDGLFYGGQIQAVYRDARLFQSRLGVGTGGFEIGQHLGHVGRQLNGGGIRLVAAEADGVGTHQHGGGGRFRGVGGMADGAARQARIGEGPAMR